MTQINLASEFSEYPAGRYLSDGEDSGERFRDELLAPRLKKGESVSVVLDGAMGYGSSFLEEAFGGLVRVCGFSAKDLHLRLEIISEEDPTYIQEIWQYIEDEDKSLGK